MASCDDIDRLLTPYLDDEAAAEDRRAVDAHLRQCPWCARRARAEGVARTVLRVRARAAAPRAPAALRLRCEAVAGRSRPGAVGGAWGQWRALGLAVAAMVVVGLAGLLVSGAVARSPGLLVAELTLDHLKCFALFEPRGGPADPEAVSAQLRLRYGWHLAIPGSLARERLTLLGARRCLSTDGAVAHVLYRHGGRALSLFVMPATARPAARVALAGYVARIWSSGPSTFVLLGDEPDGAMRAVAAYFGAAGS
jgi:anti-sigma factor RsiW